MNKRNLNIELLRILSMLMIVYHHFAIHTHWNFPEQLGTRKYFILSIENFGKGGVLLFILITGYFFSRQKITVKKIFHLNNTVTFYALSLFFISLFWLPFNIKTFISSALPIIFYQYWFVTIYTFLIVFQPVIRRYLVRTPKKTKLKNWAFLIIFTYIPTLLGVLFQIERYFTPNNILIFIIVALTGDLIREYQKVLTKKYFNYIILGFFLSFIIIQARPFLMVWLDRYHLYYPDYFINGTQSSNMLLFSSMFFVICLNIKIPIGLSAIILSISSCAFEIYLIHDNPLLRNYLWNDLFKNANFFWSPLLPVIALIEPLLVFFVCVLLITCLHNISAPIKKTIKKYSI